MMERLADIIAWLLHTQADKFIAPHCELVDPVLIQNISSSNFSIGLVYILLSIGAVERIIHYGRRLDVFQITFLVLFAGFVSCCGLTHWMRIYTLWYPGFIYESYVLNLCEYISWFTLIVLVIYEFRIRRQPTIKEYQILADQIKETAVKHGIDENN